MIPKSVLSFDELNKLIVNPKALPLEQYFGEMGIPEADKDKRTKLAEEFEELFIVILAEEFYSGINGEHLSEEYIRDYVLENYIKITEKYGLDVKEHAETFATDFARVTVKNASTPYFISADRALYNAENESQTLFNGQDYQNATDKGYKYKIWNAIVDNVTRDSHLGVAGQMVEIDMPFRVGDSLMLYPKDESLGADLAEIINCRCWLTYRK